MWLVLVSVLVLMHVVHVVHVVLGAVVTVVVSVVAGPIAFLTAALLCLHCTIQPREACHLREGLIHAGLVRWKGE